MTKKNDTRANKRERPTWVGYFTRKTKTKKEKEISLRKKYRKETEDNE